jgi:LysR family transcriptional regulator, glycine cleavage system transcriptional activator
MKSDLPPLLALTAFEAAGRLQSFTRAAEHLNVTQAAVSRQIRLLEDHLGRKLFLRSNRSVQLTSEGRNYLHIVATALTQISAATRELKTQRGCQKLTIAVDQSIGHLWLLPRLKAYIDETPGVIIELIVSDDERACLDPSVNVAIIHGEGKWPSHDSLLLFGEEVFPVCSPGYRAAAGGDWDDLQRLTDETLLDLDDHHWNWMNWRQWLTAHGISAATTSRRMCIGSYPLLIEAAKRGHGIALGWRGLVDSDLAAGRLVTPIKASLRTRFGYYVVSPRELPPSTASLKFIQWVKLASNEPEEIPV